MYLRFETHKVVKSRIGEVDFDHLTFGETFSDHMFQMDYANDEWQVPKIVPFGKIEILPSLSALHYGQSVFEGLKAFRDHKGGVNIFRPDKHAERMLHSSDRLCIPRVEKELFVGAVEALVTLDKQWIPSKKGTALYIRPFTFATEDYIGVRVSEKYTFFIITGPVGAYYKEGFNPVSLMTSGEYVRAVRGGLGEAKTAANYAASLLPAYEAKKKGYSQVLWLDGVHEKYIDEVGTMNICFYKDGTLITPPLEGTILAGVTRDSVLQLARHWGIKVEERRISIDEVMASIKDGSMTEIFGTGTAAVISPVGELFHKGETVTINGNKTGPLAQRLFDEITGIQVGERPDPFGWVHHLDI
ncbi:MAG: branched-chain amino acid aminotransferase [Methanomassiliicoccales archaeon PtaU1.Bin030]|nr:MAG: branched-chain amino acid aminotransferase [Methanomassiliicoccales archaeon PtaU1.Bin030]